MSDAVAPIFQLILAQSCKAVPVICALLLFHALMGRRLSPGARYALWLLVPVTLLFCLSIPSPLSVYNLLPVRNAASPETSVTQETPTVEPQMVAESVAESFADEIENVAPHVAAPEMQADIPAVVPSTTPLKSSPETAMETPVLTPIPTSVSAPISTQVSASADRRGISPVGAAALVWLGGCVVMTLVFLRQGLVCRRWIRRGRQVTEPRVLAIFGECVRLMKVRTWLVVAESTAVSGPFLIGVLRPTLLLPEKMAHGATEEQLRTVFLHELAHLKRWDVWTGWLMTCLLIVHWFNPLLWLAVRRLNDVREEACDATALARLDHVQRKNYGLSLVDIAAQFQSPGRTPGLVGISEDGRILTRRIEMIRHTGTWKSRWALLAALFALLLGAVTMTDAQEKSKALSKQRIREQIDMLEGELQTLKEAEKIAEDEPADSQGRVSPLQRGGVLMVSPPREKIAAPKPGSIEEWFGTYHGSEGNREIGMEISEMLVTRSVPETYEGRIHYMPVTQTISQVTIYENGLPRRGWSGNSHARYEGVFEVTKSDEIVIYLLKYHPTGNEEKPVPEALKELKAKVIRENDSITLEIPKNEVWGEIKMTKIRQDVPAMPEAVSLPQIQTDDLLQIKPEWGGLIGHYLGGGGNERISVTIQPVEKNTRLLPDGTELPLAEGQYILLPCFQVVIDKNALPGVDGKDENNLYYGELKSVDIDKLTMELTHYLVGGKEEKITFDVPKKLTAKIVTDGKSLTLEFPKNDLWDKEVLVIKEREVERKLWVTYPLTNISCVNAKKVINALLPNVKIMEDHSTNMLHICASLTEHNVIYRSLDQSEVSKVEAKATKDAEAPEVPGGTYDSKEDGPRTILDLIPIMPGRFKTILTLQAVDDPKWTYFSYEGIATQAGSTLKFEFSKKESVKLTADEYDVWTSRVYEEKSPDDLKEVTVLHLCDEKNADVLQFPKTGEWDAFSLSLAEGRFTTKELSGGYLVEIDEIPCVIELIPVYNARVMPPDREFVLTIRCHRDEDRQEGTAIRDGNKLTLTFVEDNKDGSKLINSTSAVIRREAFRRPVLDITVEGKKNPLHAVKIKSNDEWEKIKQKWEELRKAQAK